MATVVNDRDVLIMGTTPRYTPPTNRGMFLTPSTAVFKLAANGQSASPGSFQFVATLLNMTGTVTWSTTGGISLVTNGNTATLNFASFTAVSGTITASISVDGQQYTQTATVTKLADGAQGQQGSRGNVDISAVTSGSIWSDSEASAALAAAGYGAPQVRDLVNLYRADRTFSAQRMYNGSAWIAVDYVWNGNVFVKGSILPEAIDTRGLTIRDAGGNVILSAGMSLAQQVRTNPNLCPTPQGFKYFYNGSNAQRNGDGRFGDGQYLVISATSDRTYTAAETAPLGISWGSYYTVSFEAYCVSGTRVLNVDMFNDQGWDSAGTSMTLTTTLTRFSFSEQAVGSAAAALGRLRMFCISAGDSVIITNIKVELGTTVTPWCSNVITPANVSTFVQAAAINLAQINTASIGNLSAMAATIGLLRTATSGARVEIADNLITGYRSNNTMSFKIAA